jgi:hypothetical protein
MNSTRPVLITGGLVSPGGSATAVLRDNEGDSLQSAVCPMCHTSAKATEAAIEAGGDWRCIRCGQHWDAARLATVAAYIDWSHDREREVTRSAEGDHTTATQRDGRVAPKDVTP